MSNALAAAPREGPTTREGASRLLGLGRQPWRQRRFALLYTFLFVALVSGSLVWLADVVLSRSCAQSAACEASMETRSHVDSVRLLLWLTLAFPAIVAVRWGPALVNREYGSLAAQSRDKSAARQLLASFTFLAIPAVIMAAVLAWAVRRAAGTLTATAAAEISPWSDVAFHTSAVLVSTETLFALAIGVTAGLLLRRPIPALGAALLAFVTVRILLARARPYLLPPEVALTPVSRDLTDPTPIVIGVESLRLDTSYIDANGSDLDVGGDPLLRTGCLRSNREQDLPECLESLGVAYRKDVFQPVERIESLQLLESCIYLVLAAVLLAVACHHVTSAVRPKIKGN